MRLIDADRLRADYFVTGTTTNNIIKLYVSQKQIDDTPTIDADENTWLVHGKWKVNTINGYKDMTCSVCGWLYEYYLGLEEEWNYCPHCGAKMDLNEVNDEKPL